MSSPFSKKFMSKKPVAFMTAKQSSNLNSGLKEALLKDENKDKNKDTPATMKYDTPASMTASNASTQMSPLNQDARTFFESYEEDGGTFEDFNNIYSPEFKGGSMAEALGSDSMIKSPTVFTDSQREIVPELYQTGVDLGNARKLVRSSSGNQKNFSTDELASAKANKQEMKRLIGLYNTLQSRMDLSNKGR